MKKKTEKAIALKYNNNLPAPIVIAKGERILAEAVKNLAKAHNIPIIEKEDGVVDTLFHIDIGDYIPEELFGIVAEILAFVYMLQGENEDIQNS